MKFFVRGEKEENKRIIAIITLYGQYEKKMENAVTIKQFVRGPFRNNQTRFPQLVIRTYRNK